MFTCQRHLEIENLHLRVRELEDKVQHLRFSRRVLMNILETLENEKQRQREILERTNQRLRRGNRGYALRLMEKNLRIIALQEQINRLERKGS
ncbi:MAG: translation initiation factor 2 [Firmicutes bacterium]|nr:translation initiation factor 2 [Bacillota bacterium]